MDKKPLYSIGQVIHHKLFGYRGVIYTIDPTFNQSDEWYDTMAKSRPPKNEPWYGVMVDDAAHITYVAQQNLELLDAPQQISHPALGEVFSGCLDGKYRLKKNQLH